jgi:hypothetical protein
MDLLPYYVESTNKRLDEIEKKIDTLLKFKWQIIGGSLAISLAGSIIISAISAYYYLGFVK